MSYIKRCSGSFSLFMLLLQEKCTRGYSEPLKANQGPPFTLAPRHVIAILGRWWSKRENASRRNVLRLTHEMSVIISVFTLLEGPLFFLSQLWGGSCKPKCFLAALMKKWEERVAWADTFQRCTIRLPKNSHRTTETKRCDLIGIRGTRAGGEGCLTFALKSSSATLFLYLVILINVTQILHLSEEKIAPEIIMLAPGRHW